MPTKRNRVRIKIHKTPKIELLSDIVIRQSRDLVERLLPGLLDQKIAELRCEQPGCASIPPLSAGLTPAPEVPGVHCSVCGRLHNTDSKDYVTFHGVITVGETRQITTGPIRTCLVEGGDGSSACFEQVGNKINTVFLCALDLNPEIPSPFCIDAVKS